MQRVLVTGAGGFIGWHVVNILAKLGFEVHATGRRQPNDLPHEVIFHTADLLASDGADSILRMVKPTHLLHLAWNAQPGVFWNAKDNLDWVAASMRLYRAFANAGGKRAVFAGSCAEYCWSRPLLIESQTPLIPNTLYGECKHALHKVLEHAAKLDGIQLAWGRIFWLYGPREQPGRLVSDLISNLIRSREVPCSNGVQLRDFMYVEDVAQAFVQLLCSQTTGAINIGTGQSVSVASIIKMISNILGKTDLVRMGALPNPPNDPQELIADISILRGTLGFQPRFTLSEGINKSINWWKHNN